MLLLTKRAIVILLTMAMAIVLSVVLRPPKASTDQAHKIDLEIVIPKQAGEWSMDNSMRQVLPPPEVQESLNRIYSQTLSRTYINPKGQRVMLSIAYGDGFNKQLDVHRPEYCYPSQGFQVGSFKDEFVPASMGNIPVRRLVASQSSRNEPITYWITVSDVTLSNTWYRKIISRVNRWNGKADSGMLVRVSSIDNDEKAAYAVQEEFIRAFVLAIPDKSRNLIVSF
jgi:EpsI family protein